MKKGESARFRALFLHHWRERERAEGGGEKSGKVGRAEIRSEERKVDSLLESNKKGRCQRSPDGRGGSRRARWTRKKQSLLYPVFQMESSKPNTSYLSVWLSLGPGGKPTKARRGDRVKILSYFRMTGLGLVSRLALVDIWSYRGMLRLGNDLFDTAHVVRLIEINRITARRKL